MNRHPQATGSHTNVGPDRYSINLEDIDPAYKAHKERRRNGTVCPGECRYCKMLAA